MSLQNSKRQQFCDRCVGCLSRDVTPLPVILCCFFWYIFNFASMAPIMMSRSLQGLWTLQTELRKYFDKENEKGVKKFTCFSCGSDKHLKRDCPWNRGWETERVNVNSVLAEKPETENEIEVARIDIIKGDVPMGNITDKLSKSEKNTHKRLTTSGRIDVLYAVAKTLVEDVLLPPYVLEMLWGARINSSFAWNTRSLSLNSGDTDEKLRLIAWIHLRLCS
ncbi:hypothetical protein NPIL_655741 [Nephila pilipes]|uniref:CCHC-type domain-containing protein n=1 Tax=Nephila pilipes TaxID=299642 RepID=A0A8X6I3F4_NEPPI|nr:hypothetical protein NPIL_655741 [Nephila pilipes]